MTNKAAKTADTPFTHTAYFFIRTGARKGRVIGYWKDGGRLNHPLIFLMFFQCVRMHG